MDITTVLIYRYDVMKSLSKLQKAFLILGGALVAASLLISPQNTPISILTPDIVCNQFSIAPHPNIDVTEIHPDSIVFVSNLEPQARLTISKNGNFGKTPEDIVKSLCRNDHCTYTAYEDQKIDCAIARFQSDSDLQLILIRSQKQQVWMEYKGSAAAFAAFEQLISELHRQAELNNHII